MANLNRSLITDLPMFAGVGVDRLDEILNEAQSLRYAKGTNVFEQDAPATSFFILLDGHLRVAKLTPAGQQVVVRFVAPGEIFGVAKAIGRTTYPATATAVVDSVALVWPSAAWPRLIEKNPALAANALQTVGTRLQEANTGSDVWGDTAYRSRANERLLAENGRRSQIHRKKPPRKPMPKHTARANGAKSKVRAAVEHVFAHEKGPMGLVVRTIGLARARVKIGLANLVYNMKRTIWLTGRLAPA